MIDLSKTHENGHLSSFTKEGKKIELELLD